MNLKATAAHAAHEPTLHCPNCNHEIKLTESLAAPLIEETRRRFQEQLANKDAEVAKKTEALRQEREQLEKSREQIEDRSRNGSRPSAAKFLRLRPRRRRKPPLPNSNPRAPSLISFVRSWKLTMRSLT